MPEQAGTLTLASLRSNRFQSVAEFGLDTIDDVLQRDLQAHNLILQDMLTSLCDFTTDRLRKVGSSSSGRMTKVDENGRAVTQARFHGSTVGFPLEMFQRNLGWNEKYFQTYTVADMAEQVISAQKDHRLTILSEIKRALYIPTNYVFDDYLDANRVDLNVKRLVNGDGDKIPDGPDGQVFDGATHTHYLWNSGLNNDAARALVNDVLEHGHGGNMVVAINELDESAWLALPDFAPAIDMDVRPAANTTYVQNQGLDTTRLNNRYIGKIRGARVWTKPWVPEGYAFAWDTAASAKPLAFRQRAQTSLQGLRTVGRITQFPHTVDFMEAEFGLGVANRTNGAVLYYADGAASYVMPTVE